MSASALKRILAAVAPLLLAAVATGAQGQGPPPDLEQVLSQSRARLCEVYRVPEPECGAPVNLTVASPAEAAAAGLPGFAAGAANPRAGAIILVPSKCGSYPFGDVPQTLRHEVSHVLLYRALGYAPPRWLDEGLAMRAAGEWTLSDDVYSVLALHAVARGKWKLEKVEGDFREGEGSVRRSYALAKAFVRDLFPRDDEVTDFLAEARRRGSVDAAFGARFGTSPDQAFQSWAKNLPWWGEWLVAVTSPTALWIIVTLLFVAAFFAAVRRRRAKFEQLPD